MEAKGPLKIVHRQQEITSKTLKNSILNYVINEFNDEDSTIEFIYNRGDTATSQPGRKTLDILFSSIKDKKGLKNTRFFIAEYHDEYDWNTKEWTVSWGIIIQPSDSFVGILAVRNVDYAQLFMNIDSHIK